MSFTTLLKKILIYIKNNRLLIFFAKYIVYFYTRLLFFTYRLEVSYEIECTNEFNRNEGIYYFWTQNLIMGMYFFYKKRSVGYCISSSSNDGKIVGFIAEKLGFKVLYNSNKKLSVEFVKDLIDIVDVNKRICLIGDGSRGPAFSVQPSLGYFAAKTKVPLIFIECSSSSVLVCKKSWSKFQIPLPFSKIFIKVHSPYLPSMKTYKRDIKLLNLQKEL